MTLSQEERVWLKRLRDAYRHWDRSTHLFAKGRYDPVKEREAQEGWFALLNEREAYLRTTL